MGKLFSKPKAPRLPPLPAVETASDTSTSPSTPSEPADTPETLRVKNLLTRNRSMLGNIATSARGLTASTDTTAARKSLLGE